MNKPDYIICNAIASHKEAPVSALILEELPDQVLQAIKDKGINKGIFLVDEKDYKAADALRNAIKDFPSLEIDIKSVDARFNMVLQEPSAIKRLLEGEKPIPFLLKEYYPLYSCEKLVAQNKNKTVYIKIHQICEKHTLDVQITPHQILEKCNPGHEQLKGMYFGWPMGQFIGKDEMDKPLELTCDFIYIATESDCFLNLLNEYAKEFAIQSCGKCVFCREGTKQMKMILSDMTNKKGKNDDIDLLLDLCSQVKHQVLCTLGVVAATTVESAISSFREEIGSHITKKTCKALVCNKFVTYHILADKCTGCEECKDVCGEDAIEGKKGFIHVINQDDCTQCGMCIGSCADNAIVKAGVIKPKCPVKPMACGTWVK